MHNTQNKQRRFILSILTLITMLTVSFPTPVMARATAQIGGEEVTKEVLDMFNPIKDSTHPEKLETPGAIISFFLADFAFYLAGLILFVMLVWGGFEMIAGATNKKSLDAGKQRVTAALIGFLILFSVYWLAKILESVFNIEILF